MRAHVVTSAALCIAAVCGSVLAGTVPASASPVPAQTATHYAVAGQVLVPLREQPTDAVEPSGEEPATGGVQWEEFGGDPADAPTDLNSFIDSTLGWLKTIALFAGVLGLLIVACLMVIGIRGRSEVAKKAMEGVFPVLLGTVFAGSAYVLVGIFV
ncbi:hypothetical protein [Rhodococcus opacus]|uniref:hypothetical protein n=1 Tax=Rhodococcus opacus TaxID=37919 RepID=UPI00046D2E38|nr:hypothetical protein [Rhodococcus opacus]UDH01778.1 hypothetical protein K2Z90_008238 [Rhodococcus opacus PD630]